MVMGLCGCQPRRIFSYPVECGRILASDLDLLQETRVKLARLLASLGYNQEIPYPDIFTKAKAQEFIGLDMTRFRKGKAAFLKISSPPGKKLLQNGKQSGNKIAKSNVLRLFKGARFKTVQNGSRPARMREEDGQVRFTLLAQGA